MEDIKLDEIINILMRRDNLSEEEAQQWVEETMDEVMDMAAAGNLIAAEDYFVHELGLEPDYLFDLLMR